MQQIKNKFDVETKRKIKRSFYLSLWSVGGAFIASLGMTRDAKIAGLVALATFGAFIKNSIDEYIAGEEKK